MNRECIYNNGSVTVIDDLGVARPVEYTDNLEEILVQENLIEEMEDRIEELEEKLENNDVSKFYIPSMFLGVMIALITAEPICNFLFGADISMVYDTILSTFTMLRVFITVTFLPYITIFEIISYLEYKHFKKI